MGEKFFLLKIRKKKIKWCTILVKKHQTKTFFLNISYIFPSNTMRLRELPYFFFSFFFCKNSDIQTQQNTEINYWKILYIKINHVNSINAQKWCSRFHRC